MLRSITYTIITALDDAEERERGGSSISGNDVEMGKSVTGKNQQSTVISLSFQNYLVSQDPDH